MLKMALCVGVNRYSDRQISKLKVCENDAFAIAEILSEAPYSYDRVQQLTTNTDDHPSKSNILNSLRDLAENAIDDDLLLFYFSGHGSRNENAQYLLPSDAHPKDFPNSYIDFVEIKNIIKSCKAKKKVIIIDACKCGEGLTGLKDQQMSSIDPEKIRHDFIDVKGVYIYFSSSRDQVSWEHTNGRHSVFSDFLIQALKGEDTRALRDRKLTTDSLFEFLAEHVQRYSRVYCSTIMTPVYYSVATAPLVMADFTNTIYDNGKNNVEQVFMPAATPTYTYVTREKENDFLSSFRQPGKIIYLHGPSGCGKTCLYDKVLTDHKREFIFYNCVGTIDNPSILYRSIYKEVASRLSDMGKSTRLDSSQQIFGVDVMRSVARELVRNDVTLILDDFHRLNKDIVGDFADALKVFISYKTKIILVGVTNTANLLFNVYPDLNIRMDGIELSCLSTDELAHILTKGQDALNFEFSAALSRGIVKEALGSASLVHDIAATILNLQKIEKKLTSFTRIEDIAALRPACMKVAEKKAHSYSSLFRALSYDHSKAKIYAPYRMAMCAIALQGRERMMIHKDSLYTDIEKRFEQDSNLPSLTGLTQALKNFRDIQKNVKEVISYNEHSEEIEITDSGFKFFLNWIVRPQFISEVS